MQFGIQFAELLVRSEDVIWLFDIFPGDFQDENIMFFGRVPFLETVDHHVGYTAVRLAPKNGPVADDASINEPCQLFVLIVQLTNKFLE